MNAHGSSVPAKSLDAAIKHVEAGGRLMVPTATRCTVIDQKTLQRIRAADVWLLKEDGNGYRLRTGKASVFLLPGQLRYAD